MKTIRDWPGPRRVYARLNQDEPEVTPFVEYHETKADAGIGIVAVYRLVGLKRVHYVPANYRLVSVTRKRRRRASK
jgi:hypothetical protein